MAPGFYWYFKEGQEPEIVRVLKDGEVHFCGIEAFWWLPATGKSEFVLKGGRFVGPLTAPEAPQ